MVDKVLRLSDRYKYTHDRSVDNAEHLVGIHLIVELQGVLLTLGLEVLCVVIYGEVHLAAEALNQDGVPVVVVQQAAQGHRQMGASSMGLGLICRRRMKNVCS